MNHTTHLCLCSFSPDEREVLELIIARVDAARSVYGPLVIDADPRDFEYEAHLEDVDAVVYRTIHTIKRRRSRR